MSESDESPARPAAARRDRSIAARREARRAKAGREKRIVDLLNRGVSVAELATREGLTQKRMRALVQEILARRMPQPPAEFLALQVGRLNEALIVAFGAMADGNLQAVDRVARLVRELDRYHGFSAAPAPAPAEPFRLAPPPQTRLALAPPSAEPAGNGAATD
jgi:hypothetical protein